MTRKSPYTKIISWNINSITSKYPELQILSHDYKPLLICLQETKLRHKNKFTLKGYSIYRKDLVATRNHTGGVLVAVHNSTYSEAVTIQSSFQAVVAKIYISANDFITICSIYLHNDHILSVNELENLCNQVPQPYILTGDTSKVTIPFGDLAKHATKAKQSKNS